MSNIIAFRSASAAPLALAQAAWDQFFTDVLAKFRHPNPDLCRDWALDRTIRALGQRPCPPLTLKDRENLKLRMEVDAIFANQSVHRSCSLPKGSQVGRKTIDRASFEALCDVALENCEVA